MRNKARARTLKQKIAVQNELANETLATDLPINKPVSPAELMGLTIVQLRKLSRNKQLRGRSKLKTKRALIQALKGVLTSVDLDPLLPREIRGHNLDREEKSLQKPVDPKIPHQIPVIRSRATNANRPLPEGEGNRINGKVMGIDVHLDTLAYCLIDEASILAEGQLPNTGEGIAQIIALCRSYAVNSVGMESTAEYWRKLYWALTDATIPALVANALQTKNTQGKKTDTYDAIRIAVAHRDGRLKPSVCCTREQYILRKALRDAQKEQQEATKYANQMRSFEHLSNAPKWVRKLGKSNYGRILLSELPNCTTLDAVVCAVNAAHPHWTSLKSTPIATELWAWTQQLVQLGCWELYLNRLQSYLFHEHQAYTLQLSGVKYAAEHPAFREVMELLLTSSCIGPNSAALFAAELIDIRYFPTPDGLVRWAGLNPNVDQSGFRKNHTGKISKKGDKYLRKALFCCAQNEYAQAAHPGHPMGLKMRALKEIEKKPYKKAIVAGARHLLIAIWYMLTYKEAFRMNAPQEVLEHLQASTTKKIAALSKRIDNIASVYHANAELVTNAIQHFETVDTAVDFARVFLEAREKQGTGHEALAVFPFESLYGLSAALYKLQKT